MATLRKRGDKYQVQIRRVGQAPVSKTFHELKDARAWARMMEVRADQGELPTDRKALNVTLGELVNRYRDTISIRKKTATAERIVLAAFALHPICRKSLAQISTADFAIYRDDRLKVIKPVSLKRELVPIHNLFEIARDEWGLPIRENPLDKLRLDAPDQRRERRLRDGEWMKLVKAAQKCRNKLVPPIIRLAVETGMRRGEILALRETDFNADNQCLLIRETKNGHSRTIPLSSSATEIIRERVRNLGKSEDQNGRLFPITANSLRLAWTRATKRAELEDLHFHDLRHEAISRFFEKGLTMPEVALLSGHRDLRMLTRYAHAQRQLISQKLGAPVAIQANEPRSTVCIGGDGIGTEKTGSCLERRKGAEV